MVSPFAKPRPKSAPARRKRFETLNPTSHAKEMLKGGARISHVMRETARGGV